MEQRVNSYLYVIAGISMISDSLKDLIVDNQIQYVLCLPFRDMCPIKLVFIKFCVVASREEHRGLRTGRPW